MKQKVAMSMAFSAALVLVGCGGGRGSGPVQQSTTASLQMQSMWTAQCATPTGNSSCQSVTLPPECWSGQLQGSGGTGTTSFSNLCTGGGTVNSPSTSFASAQQLKGGLAAGQWRITYQSNVGAVCNATLRVGQTSFVTVARNASGGPAICQ